MNADGTGQTRLTEQLGVDAFPSWSPDGMQIAFHSERDGNSEIYVMDADGSNQVRLTNDLAGDSTPAWSPDGTKIAFQSGREGGVDIFLMNPDGSDQMNITNTPFADVDPDWQPLAEQVEPTPAASPTPAATVAAVGLPDTGSGDGGGSTAWPLVAALPAALAVGAAGVALLWRRWVR
jgi:dipeptidyl aminopeptidase/acylaminoacyl peptidase